MFIQNTQNTHISSSNQDDQLNQSQNQQQQQQQQFISTIKSNICNVSYFSKTGYNVHGEKTTSKTIISSHQQSMQFQQTVTNKIPTSWSPFVQGLRYAVYEDQGKRKHMENSTKIVDMTDMINNYDLLTRKLSFSLFDGHLGGEAATFCTEYLAEYVAEFINNNNDNMYNSEHIEDSIRNAFHHIDNKFKTQYADKCQAGAVGVYAYYDTNYIYVANVGDCRAILCSNGKTKVLTQDHNTKNDMERKRCKKYIGDKSELLSGEICVTRAIGDYRKCDIGINVQYLHLILLISTILNIISISSSWNVIGLIGLIGWLFYDYMLTISCNEYKKLDGLICDPHIIKHKLCKDDEFLIIACDGLWDLFGNECAMKACRRSLRMHGNVDFAAQKLIKLAKVKSSGYSCFNKTALTTDNISVMVIGFANKDYKTGKEHIGPQY